MDVEAEAQGSECVTQGPPVSGIAGLGAGGLALRLVLVPTTFSLTRRGLRDI